MSEFDAVKVRKQSSSYCSQEEVRERCFGCKRTRPTRANGDQREQVIFPRRTRRLFYQLQVNRFREYAPRTSLRQAVLREDERILREAEATLVRPSEKWSGSLHLTNKRLIFERNRGIFFKKYEIVMDVGLADLSYVKIGGIFRKNLFVGVRNGPWVDTVHLRVNDPEEWASHVSSLIKNPTDFINV